MAAVLIAGVSSGVGKTTISLGLVRCLVNRGFQVRPFKVGPDFLDPQHLSAAAGIPCYNLDSWMTSPAYVRSIFSRMSLDADVSVIEGVMGMYDGFSPAGLAGSSAEIAEILGVPIVLIVDAHGMAGSIAPLVHGFADFAPSVKIAGVIANNCGSDSHAAMLRQALEAASLPPLIGALPKDALPHIEERHLGLVTPDEHSSKPGDLIAPVVGRYVDIDAVLEIARSAATVAEDRLDPPRGRRTEPLRIAVAQDKAFFFYYPDNLQILKECGAELLPFSPLVDRRLPEGASAIYLGGGYPELHARMLAENQEMMDVIGNHAHSGLPIYAECGGLMYLGETFSDLDGAEIPMAGVIPVHTAMSDRCRSLGYREARILHGHQETDSGPQFRGHEFHYSYEVEGAIAPGGWDPAFAVSNRKGRIDFCGYRKDGVTASYLHLHFGSNPAAALKLFI